MPDSIRRRIFELLIILCLVTLGSCKDVGNNGKTKNIEAKVIDEEVVVLPYEAEFFTLESSILTIKVMSLPDLFDLESMQNQTKRIPSLGKFERYGVDNVYQISNETLNLYFSEANEVGFRKRYKWMLEANVNSGATLDCGLKIGKSANPLLAIIPPTGNVERDKIKANTLTEVQLYDHWGIYTHTYTIKNGVIEELEIRF